MTFKVNYLTDGNCINRRKHIEMSLFDLPLTLGVTLTSDDLETNHS